MTTPLQIRDLHVTFGSGDTRVEAVAGITLDLREREILAIVGESGSGKSITARTVLGLLPRGARTAGAVILRGQDVLTADAASLRRARGSDAAMVFQEPSTALNPVYKVGWQIAEGLRAHGMTDPAARHRKAIEMMRAVGIPDPETRVDHYPHQFSGGQKQRVIIAMALALEPQVIIADEPTTALDVTVQAEILDLLRRCRDELGTSILIITHNMGVVADLADRVAVMYQGRLVELAPVKDLFANPREAYTRQLLAAVPRLSVTADDDTPLPPPPKPAETVVSIDGLEVVYGQLRSAKAFRAVRGVSFAIGRGEVLGLVGESGSGKSTIGRALVGLAPVTGGSVRLFGQDLRAARGAALRALRRRIGFVFQDPASSFNPHLTIAECIAEPIRVHRYLGTEREIHHRVAELLDQVQLPRTFAERLPYELSGGQRQRVGMARALALQPELVIADEPTSALDVSVQARLLAIFQELQRELGFATLFISHDLGVVEQVSGRVAVLKAGEMVEIGAARQVLVHPQHPYTRQLIAAVPVPDPVLQAEQRARRAGTLTGTTA